MIGTSLILLCVIISLAGEDRVFIDEENPAADEQVTADEKPAKDEKPAREEKNNDKSPRSTVQVTPGQPAIKTSEIERKPISPWKRFPRDVLYDQKHIWTSPFHTSRQDLKWWLILGSATGALIATDKHTTTQLPNTKDQIAVARWTSRFGAAYSLLPLTAGFYFAGTAGKKERFRETGLLGAETLANTFIVVTSIKLATQRQRPLQGDGTGQFWKGPANLDASFPSGHAIHSWALASIIAHQYPHPRIVPIVAYGLATTVTASRFSGRQHFEIGRASCRERV